MIWFYDTIMIKLAHKCKWCVKMFICSNENTRIHSFTLLIGSYVTYVIELFIVDQKLSLNQLIGF